MAIPQNETVFSWTHRQAASLQSQVQRLKVFYSEWANLTAGQKTGLKAQATGTIDSVVAELADIKTAIQSL